MVLKNKALKIIHVFQKRKIVFKLKEDFSSQFMKLFEINFFICLELFLEISFFLNEVFMFALMMFKSEKEIIFLKKNEKT